MNKSDVLLSIILLSLSMGCTTTVEKEAKGNWKVLNKNSSAPKSAGPSQFIPSGTELIFTQSKIFNEKNNNINIELSTERRCSLYTSLDKEKEIELSQNTVLTVVGYRGETNELVLTEPSYKQYYVSCLGKVQPKRQTSSVKKEKLPWKKVSVELKDIEKMSPLLKVKFIPPQE